MKKIISVLHKNYTCVWYTVLPGLGKYWIYYINLVFRYTSSWPGVHLRGNLCLCFIITCSIKIKTYKGESLFCYNVCIIKLNLLPDLDWGCFFVCIVLRHHKCLISFRQQNIYLFELQLYGFTMSYNHIFFSVIHFESPSNYLRLMMTQKLEDVQILILRLLIPTWYREHAEDCNHF